MSVLSSLLALVFVAMWCDWTPVCLSQLCQPSPTTTALRLRLVSRRNLTGHWESQMKLDHGGNSNDYTEDKTTGPFEVTLEHSTSTCDGKEMVHIEATVIGECYSTRIKQPPIPPEKKQGVNIKQLFIAPPRRAGPGYEMFPGVGYYKFHTDPQVWEDARRTCAKEGGHLVIINSEEESKITQQLFARHPKINDVQYNDFAFIVHLATGLGVPGSIHGDPLDKTGFTRWFHKGQPDNAGGNPGEDCGSVHRNGGLNDLICTSKHAFICEQEMW
uniref:C-type lectin domain-containing protein n=1 Tax=Timema monikensis TaxID=170555 RepID=A0A7R9EAP3_9NEOP|nr:unnamed protein product [Timema monikensis]